MHGGQQLSLFHEHHDSRCFRPIQVYGAVTGKPVAVIRKSGKTPDSVEISIILHHLVKATRRRWPEVESSLPPTYPESQVWPTLPVVPGHCYLDQPGDVPLPEHPSHHH